MKFALRALAKSPGYTAVALLTLALGIGVNTSMFSVVDAMLFQDAPFPAPGRLVQIVGTTSQGPFHTFSEQELREIRPRATAYESLTTIGGAFYSVAEPGEPPARIFANVASAELFATFRTAPLLGRAFTAEETQPGRNHVVLLAYWYWQLHYGGRSDVLGQTLRLDGEPVTIIGVMPASFDYRPLWNHAALFRPLNYTRDQMEWRDYRAFNLVGRLAPGATPTQAAVELAPLAAVQEREHPQSYAHLRYRVLPLHEALTSDLNRKLPWMLLGLAGFVLLIACANLANLQLARATAGIRDLAIRAALGATRRQLIAHQLTECILVSLAGGALGLAVAYGMNGVIERHFFVASLANRGLPIDPAVLALTIVVSLLAGILFGIVPAWIVSRIDLNAALRAQSRGSTASRSHHRLRHALIVGEVALALVLLSGAGVMQRGFVKFLQRSTGWDTGHVLTAQLAISETRIDSPEKRAELFRRIETRLKELPGVEHAAIASSIPLYSYTGERPIQIDGQSGANLSTLPIAFHVMVTSDFFATMGIPLLQGRAFAPDIKERDPAQVIVNEALARKLWPGRNPVGQRLGSIDSGQVYWAEVIGVVRDVEPAANVADPLTPLQVYKPLVQEPWSWVYVVLRGTAPATFGQSLRRALAEVDPDLPADQIGTIRELVDLQQSNLVVVARILAGFAALGVLLASIGLYGVISNLVAQRSGEFGIRLALGARPVDVLALVLGRGLVLSAIGLVLGLAGAYGLARFLGTLMPRLVQPDPVTFGITAAVLFVVALLSCWLPARRATKVDPLEAMRSE